MAYRLRLSQTSILRESLVANFAFRFINSAQFSLLYRLHLFIHSLLIYWVPILCQRLLWMLSLQKRQTKSHCSWSVYSRGIKQSPTVDSGMKKGKQSYELWDDRRASAAISDHWEPPSLTSYYLNTDSNAEEYLILWAKTIDMSLC